jgi:predicted nucleotidyltransferase
LADSPRCAVVGWLRKRFGNLLAVWAFGSRIRGQARPDSDWDLAILLPGRADPVALWNAAADLSDLLGAPVDLVDLRAASTVLQYLVVTTGERWWHRDVRVDLYEAAILSEKTALDEARAQLVRDILHEGRIHGR